jgi:hypothetical protein
MIQYIEIVNFGDQIRVVTKDEAASEFNEPIIISNVETPCISLEEILTEIKNRL